MPQGRRPCAAAPSCADPAAACLPAPPRHRASRRERELALARLRLSTAQARAGRAHVEAGTMGVVSGRDRGEVGPDSGSWKAGGGARTPPPAWAAGVCPTPRSPAVPCERQGALPVSAPLPLTPSCGTAGQWLAGLWRLILAPALPCLWLEWSNRCCRLAIRCFHSGPAAIAAAVAPTAILLPLVLLAVCRRQRRLRAERPASYAALSSSPVPSGEGAGKRGWVVEARERKLGWHGTVCGR